MHYNEHNLAVAKFAAKNGYQPEIGAVFFTDKKTVATDRYRLLEVSALEHGENYTEDMRGCTPFLIKAEDAKQLTAKVRNLGLKHLDSESATFASDQKEVKLQRVDGQFPEYEQIIPKGNPKIKVRFNGKMLRELLQVMERMNEEMTITIYEENLPIIVETESSGQTARALLMPVQS